MVFSTFKIEMLYNYRKQYWELYNEIEECSEELAVVIYKFGLTLDNKLWDDLTLNLLANLRDVMMRVDMYTRLEEDVRQANELQDIPPMEKTHSKNGREVRWTMKIG